MRKRCKTVITIDELTSSLGLMFEDHELDLIDPSVYQNAYDERYDEAIKIDGVDVDEAEKLAEQVGLDAEQAAVEEWFEKYISALEHVAEQLYGRHKLRVTAPTKMMGRGHGRREVRLLDKIKIEPSEGWRAAADEIRQTINGVGYFHFYSLKDFLDSGPYAPCEAVMAHLHWIERYPEVYGSTSARRIRHKTLRFEVDLEMIRKSVPEADGVCLESFCEHLQEIIDNDDLQIVQTFHALNNKYDYYLLAFGWPTKYEWDAAIEKTFGISILKRNRKKS